MRYSIYNSNEKLVYIDENGQSAIDMFENLCKRANEFESYFLFKEDKDGRYLLRDSRQLEFPALNIEAKQNI
jgi:hypothetical protein